MNSKISTGQQNFVSPTSQTEIIVNKPMMQDRSLSFGINDDNQGNLLYQVDIELAQHDKAITLKVHEGEEIQQLLLKMKEQIGLTDASLDEIKTLVDE